MFRPRALFGLIALIGLAGTAQAAYVPATWTDSETGPKALSAGQSYQYSLDITGDGFNVGSDLVTDFLLTIDLFDDDHDQWFELEAAFVDIPGLLGDALITTFSFGENAYAGWSVAGLLELNLLGQLTVTITSILGDFLFGGSELVANGFADTTAATNVPEPGTLGLLGVGLLGIASASARRRKSVN